MPSKFVNAWLLVLDGMPIEFNPLIMPAVTFDVVPVLVIALVYDKFDGIIVDVVIPPVTCDDGPVVRGCSSSAKIRLSCTAQMVQNFVR